MGITQILIALAKIFLLLIPGFLLKKLNIINTQQTNGVASIITKVTYPCLVINAMQLDYSIEILRNCKYVFLIYAAIIAIAFLIAKIVGRLVTLPSSRTQLLTFMLIFGNTGFIGLPVLNGVFGPEAVFYGAICDATCDVFLFTFGIGLLRSSANADKTLKRGKKDTIKEILNPCTIGVIIGLLLYITNTTLPGIVGEPVALLGAATTPLAMFIVGAQLADIQPRSLFGDRHIYLGSALKLLLMPAVALFLVQMFIGTGTLLATVIIMEAAMPAATVTVIFTQQFRGDIEFATKGVLMSTLLCIVTIPMVAVIISLL